MKQTISELGIGGEGWIIYGECFTTKHIIHITVVGAYNKDTEYLMPRYIVRGEDETFSDELVVFGNEIVYSTKEEAEEARIKEIGNEAAAYFREREQLGKKISALCRPTLKDADWKKLADELGDIQKQFENVTEDQKKDFCTFIKKIRNIADPQQDETNWKQVRIDASISILNSLLETTKHSVLEEVAVNEVYAKTAVAYADALVKELKRSEAYFEEKLKEI